MTDCCTPKGYRTIFSERSAVAETRRYRRRGLDSTSRRIFELIKKRGVQGKTLLEVGVASAPSRSSCSRQGWSKRSALS